MVLLNHLKPEVIETVRKFIYEDDKLQQYMDIFDQEISRGLDRDTYEAATIKSIITHVNKKPSGNEEGQFLGLDFSGPTIKVMLVNLMNRECTITRKLYDIPEKRMSGKSEKLFDFLAKCLADFLTGLKPKLKMSRIPLGVTFGFPIEQTSLQDCKLLRWSKGFACDDLLNKNVFLRLKDSVRKFPELKKIFVIGILNDAVSAVLACAWQDPSCMIGAVIGPGSSCCYAEKVYRVTKYEAETYGVRDIYINLESAQLGEDGCLDQFRTRFDEEMDEGTSNPGKIILRARILPQTDVLLHVGNVEEKICSGLAWLLGRRLHRVNSFLVIEKQKGCYSVRRELVRLVLLDCINNRFILDGTVTDELQEKNAIKLEHLQRIEADPDLDHSQCREVLKEFGYDATDEDCFQVQFIARVVSRRSANLVAAQLATIINRINAPTVKIAVDGDLIKNYPNYKWYLVRKIGQLKNESCDMTESEESSLGSAVMAAVFGEEVMNRDEKLRRLPGFPMDKCHFRKSGKCLNPDCQSKHPCDKRNVNPCMLPMQTMSQDIVATCMQEKKEKGGCGGCSKGYNKM